MQIIIGIGGTQAKSCVGELVQIQSAPNAFTPSYLKTPCILLQNNPTEPFKSCFALLALCRKRTGKKHKIVKFKRRTTYIKHYGYRIQTITYRVLGVLKEDNLL